MNSHFLSIKEAVVFLQNKKSYSTIQRLCKKLKSSKKTKDFIRDINGVVHISKQYLTDNFADFIKADSHTDSQKVNFDGQKQSDERSNDYAKDHEDYYQKRYVEHLENEIVEKNKQISGLLERQKEQNIIIQSLQNKLALPGAKVDQDKQFYEDIKHSEVQPDQAKEVKKQSNDHAPPQDPEPKKLKKDQRRQIIIDKYKEYGDCEKVKEYMNNEGILMDRDNYGKIKPYTVGAVRSVIRRAKKSGIL
jgi:hypothetical protein